MSFNKNGLEIDLNFDYSLNEKDLPELEDINKEKEVKESKESKEIKSQNNMMVIENNVSSITFLQKPKEIIENKENQENKENTENKENQENQDNKKNNEINQNNKNIIIQFEENNFNFPIISRKKIENTFIINKTSKFDILKNVNNITKKEENKKQIFEIIKIENIDFAPSIKETENNETKKDEIVKEEGKEEKKEEKKEKKIFTNLDKINENKIDLLGQTKDVKMDIQHKINEIEIKGKEKEKKYDKVDIVNKVNNLELIASYSKETKENKENEMNNKKLDETKIKLEQKEKEFLIHINGEKTISIPKQPLKVQKNAVNIQISNKKKESRGYINVKENVVNFLIKGIQTKKKNTDILFKKVDNFIHTKDTSQFKSKLLKNQNENNIKIKEERKKNPQLDILKTKSPNQIKIKKVPSNINTNTNPNINEKNNINIYNNDNLIKEENSNIFSKIKNNESLQVPSINSDVMNLEKQYEKIKKDLKGLYPVFSKNKQYRENFFFQLSQGNIGKYNFYLSLYKIIKDEQEEKNSNNLENYLKIKKIINGKNNGLQGKIRTKLKPLKKNSSSCSIIARNKILTSYTEENNYY